MKKSPEQRMIEGTRRARGRETTTGKHIGLKSIPKVTERRRLVKETGEMGRHDIEPGGDAYEWAQEILWGAEAVASESGGKLVIHDMEPFDMYQGPYAAGSLFGQAVKVWGGEYEGQLSIEVGGVIRYGGRVIQANWDDLAAMISGADDMEGFFAAAREAGAMHESRARED